MQVSYTALELYEYICSFDFIKFWGNQQEENVVMVSTSTSSVKFTRGTKLCFIEVILHFGSFIAGGCIAGNVFSCNQKGTDKSVRLIISSDYKNEVTIVTLEKEN